MWSSLGLKPVRAESNKHEARNIELCPKRLLKASMVCARFSLKCFIHYSIDDSIGVMFYYIFRGLKFYV